MIDETTLALMHELDWIFDGENMIAPVLVTVIHHRGQRGRFAGTRRAGHEHQPFVQHAKFFQHGRERRFDFFKIFKRKDLRRNLPEDSADTVLLVEKVARKRETPGIS